MASRKWKLSFGDVELKDTSLNVSGTSNMKDVEKKYKDLIAALDKKSRNALKEALEKNMAYDVNIAPSVHTDLRIFFSKVGDIEGVSWVEVGTSKEATLARKLKEEEIRAIERRERQITEKQERQATQIREQMEKLKRLLRSSTRVRQSQLAEYLGLSLEDLFPRLVEWADQFHFKIDGDFIATENSEIDGFVANLDVLFAEWNGKEKGKQGKV